MNKETIAIVSTRYGIEICGGGELHARMLAERLTDIYDVEVITTDAYSPWCNDKFYKDSQESINGILVRRFAVTEGLPKLSHLNK